MSYRDDLYDIVASENPLLTLVAFAAEMAVLLDQYGSGEAAANEPAPSAVSVKSAVSEPDKSRTNAERQARYRANHRNGTRVTRNALRNAESVTSNADTVTRNAESVTSNALRNVTRNASRAVTTKELNESSLGSVSAVVTEGSIQQQQQLEPSQNDNNNIQGEIESVTRNALRNAESNARNALRNAPSVTPSVTDGMRDAQAADAARLRGLLGEHIAGKLRGFFDRREIPTKAQHDYVALALSMIENESVTAADVALVCEDDKVNPIKQKLVGFRRFALQARDKRLKDQPADPDALAQQIDHGLWLKIQTRVQLDRFGEPWKAWCVEGAKREGLRSWAHFAARNMNHPEWPSE